MPTPALRAIRNLTRWTWVGVAVLALGVLIVGVFIWASNTINKRLDSVGSSVTTNALINRQVFCNTERLLLIRAVQNGYTIPANAATDACGLPIIGNPPLPAEGPRAPITATPTARPVAGGKPAPTVSHAPTPTTAPTATPRPSQRPTPTPVCVAGICVP